MPALWLAVCAGAAMAPGPGASAPACSVARHGAVPDNCTDNTAAFRAAASCASAGSGEMLVPPGVWMTGPFNLSSHTTLRVLGTISAIRDRAVYPVVTQQPVDEAYRAPWMGNRQYQALISAYSAVNVTVTGPGVIDGAVYPPIFFLRCPPASSCSPPPSLWCS